MGLINNYFAIGGIRIEDVIKINKSSCKLLSNIPKEIEDIEIIMK